MSEHDAIQGNWIELSVEVDHEAVEPVVELFSRYGYNEGVVIEEPFTQDRDGDNVRVDVSRPFRIRTFIPQETFDTASLDAIRTVSGILVRCGERVSSSSKPETRKIGRMPGKRITSRFG